MKQARAVLIIIYIFFNGVNVVLVSTLNRIMLTIKYHYNDSKLYAF